MLELTGPPVIPSLRSWSQGLAERLLEVVGVKIVAKCTFIWGIRTREEALVARVPGDWIDRATSNQIR